MIFSFQIGFLEVNWVNLLDIALVTILLYNLYRLIKGGVALRIFIGFLALYLMYLVVKATEMDLLTTILGQFMNVGVLAAIILFQQEIRKFLLFIGKTANFANSGFLQFFKSSSTTKQAEFDIAAVVEAMKSLGAKNTGALIVVSLNDSLELYTDSGDMLDAKISKRLIQSIFFKNSPLHDGAAILHNGRIIAARCILPVSDNPDIPAHLGLRHRAGIGLTELSDAAVLVVSEETGQLSFVQNGVIIHNLSPIEIRQKLKEYLQGDSNAQETTKPSFFKALP